MIPQHTHALSHHACICFFFLFTSIALLQKYSNMLCLDLAKCCTSFSLIDRRRQSCFACFILFSNHLLNGIESSTKKSHTINLCTPKSYKSDFFRFFFPFRKNLSKYIVCLLNITKYNKETLQST